MATYKSARAQILLNLLVGGASPEEAATAAKCSVFTARRFRTKHWDQIRELQSKTTAGVLESLRELLPRAVKALETLVVSPNTATVDLLRTIRVVFAGFQLFRDQDLEERIRKMEQTLEGLNRGAPQ